MRLTLFLGIFIALSTCTACRSNQFATVSVPKTRTDSTTAKVPIMTFETKMHDFGTIAATQSPEFVYKFTNTGNTNLDIDIVTACDCTDLDWTRGTVAPGKSGMIKATFMAPRSEKEDRNKALKKQIDIILKQTSPLHNYPIVETIEFTVHVKE